VDKRRAHVDKRRADVDERRAQEKRRASTSEDSCTRAPTRALERAREGVSRSEGGGEDGRLEREEKARRAYIQRGTYTHTHTHIHTHTHTDRLA